MSSSGSKFYHVFTASNGNNVLYIDSIKKALDPFFKQTVFVSAYCPLRSNEYKRWFHPFTDLFRVQTQNKLLLLLRYCIRYVEFVSCLSAIYIKCLFARPSYLNLSTSTLLKVEYYFVAALKKIGVKPIYTVHDAQQFEVGFKRMSSAKLKKFYNLFDYVIVHNNLSREILQQKFLDSNANFVQFPFPVMDLNQIKRENALSSNNKSRNFLFIGYFRKEKGYDILLEAWRQLECKKELQNNCKLTFAGMIPPDLNLPETIQQYNLKHVFIKNKYLSDEEFVNCIDEADLVVLPYRIGTNSGVLSTVMSMGKIVICSDIPSLSNHPLVLSQNLFKTENTLDLHNRLDHYISLTDKEIGSLKTDAFIRYNQYKETFESEIVKAFSSLIN